jgi:hypothetical protein
LYRTPSKLKTSIICKQIKNQHINLEYVTQNRYSLTFLSICSTRLDCNTTFGQRCIDRKEEACSHNGWEYQTGKMHKTAERQKLVLDEWSNRRYYIYYFNGTDSWRVNLKCKMKLF